MIPIAAIAPAPPGTTRAALYASRYPVLEALARRVQRGGWRAPLLDGQLKTALEQGAYERLLRSRDGFSTELPLSELRFGHESCEHLLPSPKTWLKAGRLAKRLGLGFSAMLPPTYASREDEVLAVLEALDALASELGRPVEVSAADWGSVTLIQEREGLRPCLGRVMNRMKRFERWTRERPAARTEGLEAASKEQGTPVDGGAMLGAQVAMFRRSPFGAEASRALGESAGVTRHEYDPVPQGIEEASVAEAGLPIAIHAPWTYITQGRRCVTRELLKGPGVHHGSPCSAPCLDHLVLSDYRERKNGPLDMEPIVQKGNAVFMENTRFLRLVAPPLREGALWIIRPVL